ncbi:MULTISPECIES: hypothetical protein [Paenarthrobacter]|jgi:hypothetical protein|uniref:Uncharacterized protein n=1 Tax=Paenarthrobacter aromaticivorans TaxID=2849150 RepID=A0ABS6I7N8_9MICC|nr:hypothetical protein [Paenarthrobacter sp. MMS21-TAE1-1]MBU8866452.1 hypothetical protein [Paenarthrobacter sp. MMS21-TAE1-1]
MPKRTKDLRFYKSSDAPKERTLFNDQLLRQGREDVFVVLHQMGLIR